MYTPDPEVPPSVPKAPPSSRLSGKERATWALGVDIHVV